MKIPIFQVDAFTKGPFSGNPAAVCPLPHWIDDELMQKIALENNLSETAFFTDEGNYFHIRWFTPVSEVRLCGHATLASGFVLKEMMGHEYDEFQFESASGRLKVIHHHNKYTLDFPSDRLEKISAEESLDKALGDSAVEYYKGKEDYLLVFNTEEQVKNLHPNFEKLKSISTRGVIVTAPGEDCDFISRGFFPAFGINEDPATGSAHTSLTPYWSHRLDKKELTAIQWSDRKGYFECTYANDRCLISGNCHLYMSGTIYL